MQRHFRQLLVSTGEEQAETDRRSQRRRGLESAPRLACVRGALRHFLSHPIAPRLGFIGLATRQCRSLLIRHERKQGHARFTGLGHLSSVGLLIRDLVSAELGDLCERGLRYRPRFSEVGLPLPLPVFRGNPRTAADQEAMLMSQPMGLLSSFRRHARPSLSWSSMVLGDSGCLRCSLRFSFISGVHQQATGSSYRHTSCPVSVLPSLLPFSYPTLAPLQRSLLKASSHFPLSTLLPQPLCLSLPTRTRTPTHYTPHNFPATSFISFSSHHFFCFFSSVLLFCLSGDCPLLSSSS